MNSLAKLLVDSAIIINFTAVDSSDIITVLGKQLFEAGYTRETFIEAAIDREKEMPTGLPLSGNFNAAIPHTDIIHVKKAGVALGTLSKPVIFQNMAKPVEPVPVQLVFLLALEQPKSQIEMLQEVARVLQNEEIIRELMSAKQTSEIYPILCQT